LALAPVAVASVDGDQGAREGVAHLAANAAAFEGVGGLGGGCGCGCLGAHGNGMFEIKIEVEIKDEKAKLKFTGTPLIGLTYTLPRRCRLAGVTTV